MIFKYKDIEMPKVDENRDLNLYETYKLCAAELALQQSKRDQIIAFYMTLISFMTPTIINLDIPGYLKLFGMLVLYVFGVLMTQVIVRYRVYKEVY